MSLNSALVFTMAAVFAFLTAYAFAPIAGWIDGVAAGWGYVTLFLAAGAGVSLVVVPDALHRRYRP